MSYSAVDAFAGAGGFSLGLRQAGWNVVAAFDNDPVAVATYERNLGSDIRLLDADQDDAQALVNALGLDGAGIDLLVGGPPCQGFSLQRRGDRTDARNALVLRFVDLIVEMQPASFVMENVPAVTSTRGQHLVRALAETTSEIGYRTHIATLDAADYGVAQRRRRTFFVGIYGDGDFEWPTPTAHGSPRTVAEALEGLPSPPLDGTPHPDVANHYREARLSALNRERIRHVPPGGGRAHLPSHLQLACHQSGHRHLDTYGRLAWDEPAVTITARFDSFTRGKFGHPEEDRSITLREGARLQGFPDDFVFDGTREDGARLIGNAVPPPVAQELGAQIMRTLASMSLAAA